MFDTFLVPEKTAVSTNGDAVAVEITPAKNRTFLLALKISDAVEQESLDVSIWASADGQTWGTKPIASFQQMFYAGQQPMLVDLESQPEAKFLRAHWEVNRWGRGPETPKFEFSVRLTEVAPEMLK